MYVTKLYQIFTISGDIFKNKSIVGSEFVATVKEVGPTVGPYNTGSKGLLMIFELFGGQITTTPHKILRLKNFFVFSNG